MHAEIKERRLLPGHILRRSVAYIQQGVGCSDEDWPLLQWAFQQAAEQWEKTRAVRALLAHIDDAHLAAYPNNRCTRCRDCEADVRAVLSRVPAREEPIWILPT